MAISDFLLGMAVRGGKGSAFRRNHRLRLTVKLSIHQPCVKGVFAMCDAVLRGMFQGLVLRIGGVDAAAAVIAAKVGVGHKGTVSKMCNGDLAVSISAAAALEEALREYPITEYLAARRGDAVAGGSIADLAGQSMVSAGAAHAALMRALGDGSVGGAAVSPCEAADIVARASELAEVVARIVTAAKSISVKGAVVVRPDAPPRPAR